MEVALIIAGVVVCSGFLPIIPIFLYRAGEKLADWKYGRQ